MRSLATNYALVLSLLIVTVVCADDWPVACHDLSRSGVSQGTGPAGSAVVWTATLGGSVDGSPVVSGDRIYVGTSEGTVAALARSDGGILWTFRTGGPVTGAVCLGGGRVFAGSADGMLYALEADTGALIWRHRTNRPILSAVVLVDDAVILGSMDGSLRSVNASDGRLRWAVAGTAGISAPPAVRDGILYYGDEAGLVAARMVADGSLVWQARVAGSVVAAPTLAGQRLFVPLMSFSALSPPATEFICAFNASDGARPWHIVKPQAQSVMSSPAFRGNTLWAFVVEGYTSSGILRGLNMETGEQAIEVKLGTLVVDGALAIAGDSLYFVAQDGQVYVCDAQSGAVRTKLRLGGPAFSSPAIAGGLLYVGCQDGKLYCIE